MAQQRWKPGVERNDFFTSQNLVFQKIDEERGNGICAGPEGIKKNVKLISEGALICSVLNKIRFPSSHHHQHLPSPPPPIRYCSMCCCFMGSPNEEIERLQKILRQKQQHQENSSSFRDAQDYFSLVNDQELFSSSTFTEHHLWFAKGKSSENNNIFQEIRCDRCHEQRCLNPQLPQTLEEVSLFLSSLPPVVDDRNDNKNLLRELIYYCKNFDEGIFGMARAIFMIADEVVGGCILTKEERSQKRGNWVDKKKKFHQKVKFLFRRKKNASSAMMKHYKTKTVKWKVSKLLKKFQKKLLRQNRNAQSRCYFNPKNLAEDEVIFLENDDEDVCSRILVDSLYYYSSEIHARIDFFCSCFDAGLRPKNNDSSDIDKYRRVVTLLNLIITEIAQHFLSDGEKKKKKKFTKRAFRFISLEQLLTLRCCLQNNQHRSLVPNPLKLVLGDSDDEDEDDNQQNDSNNSQTTSAAAAVLLARDRLITSSSVVKKFRKQTRKILFNNHQNKLVSQTLNRGLFRRDHPLLGFCPNSSNDNDERINTERKKKKSTDEKVVFLFIYSKLVYFFPLIFLKTKRTKKINILNKRR